MTRLLVFTLGIVAGIVLSIIVVAHTSASRPAAQQGVVPLHAESRSASEQRTGAPTLTPAQRPGNTGGVPSLPAATASPRPTTAFLPGSSRSVASVPASLRGDASWVRASLGAHYLAARMPRGTVLRITGPLGSVVRVVTDYGPSRTAFPGRVVDLSANDYQRVCGPLSTGVCPVSVTVR